jgi:hypothetical protein
VTTVPAFDSRPHVMDPPPQWIRAPSIAPPTRGVTSSEAILPRPRREPSNRSRSTLPAIPATCPVDVHCQNVQPFPPQLSAGTLGACTPQWAIHNG